jgi:hypothetical protein
MRKIFVGFIVLGLAAVGTATAAGATPHKDHRFTIAVYGDAPYGNSQFSSPDTKLYDASPGFINTINGDPDVSLVAPVGDIHSGKEFCTEAYDTNIKALWGAFADPLVYTPGDNEWSDCHKPGEGGGKLSTAADGSKFIDLTAPAASATSTTRTVLRSTTSRSCVRCSSRSRARRSEDTSAFGNPVLLFNGDSHIYCSDNPLQAGPPCTMENQASGTETTCAQAATDNPGLNITADAWQNQPSYAVTNFHRVTVHGSSSLEWLKLGIDPDATNQTSSTSFGPFSWQREPYTP